MTLVVKCAKCNKTALIPNWVFITCPPESIATYLGWYPHKSSHEFYCSVECVYVSDQILRVNPNEIQINLETDNKG